MKNGKLGAKSVLRTPGKTGACAVIVLACLVADLAAMQDSASQVSIASAGDFVAGIYTLVSSDAGKLPDWDKVRG